MNKPKNFIFDHYFSYLFDMSVASSGMPMFLALLTYGIIWSFIDTDMYPKCPLLKFI